MKLLKETRETRGTAKLMETVIGTFALALVREGIDYEALPLEGKGVLYAIVNAAKGIVEKHVKSMNAVLKADMEKHDGRVYETDIVKITLDAPESQTVETVDAEAVVMRLHEGEGMSLPLAEKALKGVVQTTVSYSTDPAAIRDAVDRGVLSKDYLDLIETRETQRAPRLIVSGRGDLKKRLADLKKRALPSGK